MIARAKRALFFLSALMHSARQGTAISLSRCLNVDGQKSPDGSRMPGDISVALRLCVRYFLEGGPKIEEFERAGAAVGEQRQLHFRERRDRDMARLVIGVQHLKFLMRYRFPRITVRG